ncbi:xyloglucan endotransglucosylase/hydrolase protein 2 [Eucalyptus grandis]|uniref:xyloglucan endotransglucosylase/hydrolase protein 2 n=1 Tax=Eucalyptus grandis TaxID=71139 RepID=UPI00192E789A|nr:xyloglucan endotransglucosylase/hydrolase protein 2 [Eucalyptus grandis]
MESFLLSGLLGFLMVNMLLASGIQGIRFYRYYNVTWGNSHFSSLYNDTEVQLTLDQSSGAGFESISYYQSGLFNMRIKIPEQKSPGVLTAFYLTSKESLHDEVDFEFIGSNGPPYTLSTNVYTKGVGGREQNFHLWFDPTTDFHSYKLVWNLYRVVFFVDKIPIRVFENLGAKGTYPTQAMKVAASIWNAQDWAGKIDWSNAPFTAHFQDFDIDGCALRGFYISNCASRPRKSRSLSDQATRMMLATLEVVTSTALPIRYGKNEWIKSQVQIDPVTPYQLTESSK